MITTINEFKMFLEELENIYMITGILTLDKDISSQEDIYSKIRSLKGVTILTTKEVMDDKYQDKNKYKVSLSIKIDKYPYINNDEDGFHVKEFVRSIRNIQGVVSFFTK